MAANEKMSPFWTAWDFAMHLCLLSEGEELF